MIALHDVIPFFLIYCAMSAAHVCFKNNFNQKQSSILTQSSSLSIFLVGTAICPMLHPFFFSSHAHAAMYA
ncbi:hypothetical protein BDA96_02G192700 [Sorghum bicolor]|uniref:Uncharacterized protein n=2 Tax=Sorghum bicolor TaxID=4558 RepID=A0A921USV8_SORBI|nr:hypothetical protein BDA96_02G192700 [Sorghum bicolor]KXG35492.1 hypothetical protein SORBI_3002G182300 [Sorghum bicolor]